MYTVFTLVDPKEPKVVRYIGMTSQTLKWRLKSIVKMSLYPAQHGYNSKLARWVREMNTAPIVHSVYTNLVLDFARIKYLELYKEHYSDRLLNERPLRSF